MSNIAKNIFLIVLIIIFMIIVIIGIIMIVSFLCLGFGILCTKFIDCFRDSENQLLTGFYTNN